MTTHHTIAIDIIALLGSPDPMLDDTAAILCDTIASAPELLDRDLTRAIMRAAHSFDPTESNIAAMIRDTIRDNTNFDLLD